MISRFKPLFFRFLLFPFDVFVILGVFFLAYFIRTRSYFPLDPQTLLSHEQYIPFTVVFTVLYVGIYALSGGYNLYRNESVLRDVGKILFSCFVWISIITSYFFWTREFFFSRFVLVFSFVGACVCLIALRLLFRFVFNSFAPKEKALIVGTESKDIEKMLRKIGKYAYEYRRDWDLKEPIDVLVVARHVGPEILDQYVQFCFINHIRFFVWDPNILPHFVPHQVRGVQLYEFFNTPLHGWQIVAKRFMDVVGSLFAIVLFSPVFLVIAVAIKWETGGSVFFKGKRIGYGYKTFSYFKFKSMRHKDSSNSAEHHLRYDESFRKQCGDDASQAIVKLKNDPRVTQVGKVLRKYSLDELAEFFNVFLGRMSLVGYRPHEEKEVEKMPEWYRKVLTLKPGITGLAQITSRDLDPLEEAKLDLKYVENWSLLLDLKILVMTPLAMIRKRVKL